MSRRAYEQSLEQNYQLNYDWYYWSGATVPNVPAAQPYKPYNHNQLPGCPISKAYNGWPDKLDNFSLYPLLLDKPSGNFNPDFYKFVRE